MNEHASMNRIYRLVWNQVRGAWIPVAETTRGRGKGGGAASRAKAAATATALGLSWMSCAHAGPAGGQIISGKGTITQSGSQTDIRQSSSTLSIDWLSFNVGKSESVDFIQPSSSAIAVNRIEGGNGSEILGHLLSNGQVYLINPNGVIFGAGSVINVGGLVASTLDVSDASLTSATRSFTGNGSGSVVNLGTITAAAGGGVALLGNQVSNQGVVRAQLGTVALGAGSAVTLTFAGENLVGLTVDRSVLKTLAENRGLIQADGGQVLMTAGAKDTLLASVVNNAGVIEARTVENHSGRITLLGGMAAGTVEAGGTLDASAANGGDGGYIETSAAHVEVADSAQLTTAAVHGLTGTWLIDPNDFTVAASGGDITGATLSKALAKNKTYLSSKGKTAGTGSINIDDTVTWSANTLTLDAADNININAVMTASGSASLALNPSSSKSGDTAVSGGAVLMGMNSGGFTGMVNFSGSGKLSISGTTYTVINSLGAAGSVTGTDLQGIEGKLAGHYVLGSNINAAATSGWNSGAGFAPIGSSSTPFTGFFNGLGHTISGLLINRSTDDLGLFGVQSSAAISDIGLTGARVTGTGYEVGALVGSNMDGIITNSFATGAVTAKGGTIGGLVGFNEGIIQNSFAAGTVGGGAGAGSVGGLVGANNNGDITNSYASGAVSGGGSVGEVGGLVGTNTGGGSYIASSYATGAVSGEFYVGGLVGLSQASDIVLTYATGQVSGQSNVGGLVGMSGSLIDSSYATGKVIGSGSATFIGGLVGGSYGVAAGIRNSYATGAVSGSSYVGGLVGSNAGQIVYSYSKGLVSATKDVGGLVGESSGQGAVSDSYWDMTTSGRTTVSGQSSNAYGTGVTDSQMLSASNSNQNLLGLTFTTVPGGTGWVIVDADGSLNNSSSTGATYPMLASEYSTTITNAHQLQLMAMAGGASYTLAQNINAGATAPSGTDVWTSAGFVPLTFSGLFDGLGHTITNLTMSSQTTDVGLFGTLGLGVVSNVGLIGGSVTGTGNVGALVGLNYGTVRNSYSTASVDSTTTESGFSTGGLVGFNDQGTISNSYATGKVKSVNGFAGGLLGWNFQTGTVVNSHATGAVSSTGNAVGGLVGTNTGTSTINNSYATGAASSSGNGVGGLAGANYGSIGNSYATGTVTGSSYVGGFVGANLGAIARSYAVGKVSGSTLVGGLVGANKVSGLSDTGTVGASFWDITTSGQSTSAGGHGMSTANMQIQANFTSATAANGNVNPKWNFTTIWVMQNGQSYPMLRSTMTPLTIPSGKSIITDVGRPLSINPLAGESWAGYESTAASSPGGFVSDSGNSSGGDDVL